MHDVSSIILTKKAIGVAQFSQLKQYIRTLSIGHEISCPLENPDS
jgi:hypothetical protein